jgi:hypothetical protein
MSLSENHVFSKEQLTHILNCCIDKSLSDVDEAHVLASKKKNKGYPGAVIEQSVLKYPADNARRPDLLVDGIETELKTTGIVASKATGTLYEAKEPVSITAVRPEKIAAEEFETSGFWEKTAHLLFVYYYYSHEVSSPAEYGDFLIKGFDFTEFSGADRERLENDWTVVRDFIRSIEEEYPDNPKEQYPRISSELNRQKLTVLDTAPKWPNRPRFRLKRRFVSAIVNEHFGTHYDKLPDTYSTFAEVDNKCVELTKLYSGKSLFELFNILGITQRQLPSKKDSERVIVRMFGGHALRMSSVEMFTKFSILGKSIVLGTNGKRTEDMKFSPVDFDELQNPDMSFEESSFRANFSEIQVLCIVFEEPGKDAAYGLNRFLGFKRFSFSDEFIETEVRTAWDLARDLLRNHRLHIVPQLRKDGSKRYNANGELRGAPNLPKSSEHIVFFRGTGPDSNPSSKSVCVDGIHMYPQNLWVKGTYMAESLSQIPFL